MKAKNKKADKKQPKSKSKYDTTLKLKGSPDKVLNALLNPKKK